MTLISEHILTNIHPGRIKGADYFDIKLYRQFPIIIFNIKYQSRSAILGHNIISLWVVRNEQHFYIASMINEVV